MYPNHPTTPPPTSISISLIYYLSLFFLVGEASGRWRDLIINPGCDRQNRRPSLLEVYL
jgi:hypothetical protein